MSLEEAYSLEINQVIDADIAYDLYWSGILTDKQKFICPGDNCEAQVTCACMDIAEQDLRQVPHFRVPNNDHSAKCSLFQDGNNIHNKSEHQTDSLKIKNNIKSNSEIFKFSRPPSHFDKSTNKEGKEKKSIHRSDGNNNTYSSSNNLKKFYSLKAIINRWIKYRKANITDDRFINIERDISYSNLFKGIYHQNVNNLPDEKFIYWGKAFINKLNNDSGYRIQFTEYLKIDDLEIKPSLFISSKMIEDYQVKSLLIKRLEKICSSDKNLGAIFVYSKPIIRNNYINFDIDNLDLIETRYLDFYEQIYKTASK